MEGSPMCTENPLSPVRFHAAVSTTWVQIPEIEHFPSLNMIMRHLITLEATVSSSLKLYFTWNVKIGHRILKHSWPIGMVLRLAYWKLWAGRGCCRISQHLPLDVVWYSWKCPMHRDLTWNMFLWLWTPGKQWEQTALCTVIRKRAAGFEMVLRKSWQTGRHTQKSFFWTSLSNERRQMTALH